MLSMFKTLIWNLSKLISNLLGCYIIAFFLLIPIFNLIFLNELIKVLIQNYEIKKSVENLEKMIQKPE